ncbi:MAG: hypothetical protein MSC30_20385 [Gaiellaceae bacterium MAG52_C11]|nr:hypothetical protein [Candidatus Gaiellasilicea maunaloa]
MLVYAPAAAERATLLAAFCMNGEDNEGTVAWGERALQLAELLGEPETIAHAPNNIGTIELLDGIPGGREKLERSLALSADAGFDDHVGRAFLNHAWAITRTRAYGDLEPIESGIEACGERGLEVWRLYMLAFRARSELDRGLWTEAADKPPQACFATSGRRRCCGSSG